ncbi:MAG TPA: zf-HC2 domain-containing protein [Thermoleophilaceae bacterium]|jgi:anti-sigma factor RsiW
MRNPFTALSFARDHAWSQQHMSEYIDAELGARGAGRIERHTDDCPECAELLASLRMMVATLAALPGRPGQSVAAAVLAGVHDRLADDDSRA